MTTHPPRHLSWAAVIAVGCTAAIACGAPSPDGEVALPALDVVTEIENLDHPWDVVAAPDGTLLTGERSGRFVVKRPDGSIGVLAADLPDLIVQHELGLMGIALATDFDVTRTLYTCHTHGAGEVTDIRVQSWTADAPWMTLTPTAVLIDGLPLSNRGRHGGCRLLPRPDGTLLISTGDATQATAPQDLNSLGGKVLRIDAATGIPAAGNPFPGSAVYTLGHRNVQGLAVRPGTGEIYSVEQGTHRDDEVNRVVAGGNYGWKPDTGDGFYDESVPMTDLDRVPGASEAVWSSGPATVATASGTFVTGSQWGDWDGALAVGVQKGRKVLFLRLDPTGAQVVAETTPPELAGEYGRIRTVAAQPNGSLLITTDNGDGDDQVLRVTPATGR
ncbi:PQQ-dependent sugar dehydrogenase [Rhodococcus opacus]|uniref:PQQ-dependent sugar dehydrogenase n=1 Tax=Rhodococcus opacus TaxID=37919 RepID=UPI0002E8FAEF|nr:PQQ-dependent sugar dehydrogenase [Rhodococcus opacus]MDX5970093.1 PQQ-dependent sugar dehydrogenase [Rhodococcus opacus]CAG7633888.1 Aldose sugar dehydrogenase YliI [Rhodococcus opacus]